MLPRLNPDEHLPQIYATFLEAVTASGFTGQVATDYATRLVTATDNSVYQIVPLAVLYPKSTEDVSKVLGLLGEERFRQIKISPRGGGTGTNGQSLSDGIILDVSRHFREILELNLEQGWVRVQPGVILDQLNAFLAPHGVFFAPTLSPSSRATIGGMINTDASGKGSRIYGKTSEHVLGLTSVLCDGSLLRTEPLRGSALSDAMNAEGSVGQIYRTVRAVEESAREKLRTEIPQLKRFLTGYDLAHLVGEDGSFDLGRVICGSEGTLAVVTEATLRLTKVPRAKALIAIRYGEFDSALRAASRLVQKDPGAIETVDDTIVGLAKKDVIWSQIAHLVEGQGEAPVRAVNLVEFESDDAEVVARKVEVLREELDREIGVSGGALGYTVATEKADIAALWTLRKKGVGLLGNSPGQRRPVPFVEDTAVPPEKLADYIVEFRALLDKRGLRYGMFGHVDVGCLHVRPALNLRDPVDEELLRGISDEVVALVKRYGGVLWGEHGRGYRSEYTPTFFGDALYAELRRVKGAFDPHNQLNPGKLATPSTSKDSLVSVDAMKRGAFDRQIAGAVREKYESAVNCNGNGACFDWNPDSVMCPSSKVTGERIHSPKGRAGILREWLRLVSLEGHDAGASGDEAPPGLGLARASEASDFSHQVYDAMNGCLACKACASQCPIHVDIPALRSDFLSQYHTRYRRPIKDYFVAILENVLVVLAWFPRVANWLMNLGFSRYVLSRWVKIVDTPMLAERTLAAGLRARGTGPVTLESLRQLSAEQREQTVVIAQDAFTTFYEPEVALAAYDLLVKLGRNPVFLPFKENGKALHVKGFLSRFRLVARSTSEYYRQVTALGLPIVGIEPAVALTYRDEYRHELGEEAPEVQLLQEYLASTKSEWSALFDRKGGQTESYRLFGHCTERTFEPGSQKLWAEVFEACGVKLSLEPTGCCGMCGVFGHEAEHFAESKGVFEMSWGKRLPTAESAAILATGHSCRSQVKRFRGYVPRHPAAALLECLPSSTTKRS